MERSPETLVDVAELERIVLPLAAAIGELRGRLDELEARIADVDAKLPASNPLQEGQA